MRPRTRRVEIETKVGGGETLVLKYLGRRLVSAVFVLWGALTAIFFIVRLGTGNPAAALLGPDATESEVVAEAHRLGLNSSFADQYWIFLKHAVTLNFGQSFQFGTSAMSLVLHRAPATLELAAGAILLILLVSPPLGIIAAVRRDSWWDRLITSGALAAQALPNFWIGIVLLLVFVRKLNVLPAGGGLSVPNLVLPAITLALPSISVLARLVRSGLIEVMGSQYVQTARIKGLPERLVIGRHAVRNMLIPVLTVAGIQFGNLLGGSVVIETVFNWPGLGSLMTNAAEYRDYAVVEAVMFFFALTFIVVNLATDIAYGYFDPRVRVEEE